MLKSGYRAIHRKLNILGHGTGHPVDIHFVRISSFGLDKDLVSVFIGKFHNLILDGRTITRTRRMDHTGVQRRTVNVPADNIMGCFICIGQITGHLFDLNCVGISREGERHNALIALLFRHFRKINACFRNSCGCPCFKTNQTNSHRPKRRRKMIRSHQSIRTGILSDITVNAAGRKINTRGKDHGFRIIRSS